MKRVFDDYGGVVITVIAVVALLGLVVFLMSDTGVMSNAFSKITGQMVDKSEQVIDDVGSLVDRAPTVEELQEKYTFEYYSTLNGAVNDVNAGTIGANADVDKADAVAGIYTDKNGGVNVVLLKDTTEATTVSPAVDMTINLGGYKLTTTAATGIDLTAGNLVIDGRLAGSGIEKNNTSDASGILVQTGVNTNLVVNGGSYFVSTDGTWSYAFKINGKSYVSGAAVNAKATAKGAHSFNISASGDVVISNCDITATRTENANGLAYGIVNNGTATVTGCDIRAYANYFKSGTGYALHSSGVGNSGTLTIVDCYVYGTHSGLQNNGTLYVNGGTYESYGHGGIYFAATGTTAYVRNATLKDSLTMPEGYTGTSQHNGAGFYIGGTTGNNIKVYMDNCKIYGSASQIVLRGSDNEQNNTLYISRSKLYDLNGDTLSVRIDNDTHKLYIGKGCNFTAENTTLPGAVVVTDEVYVQE